MASTLRKALLALLFVGLAIPLADCGRKGPLEPPPDSDYPRTYPAE